MSTAADDLMVRTEYQQPTAITEEKCDKLKNKSDLFLLLIFLTFCISVDIKFIMTTLSGWLVHLLQSLLSHATSSFVQLVKY